MLHFYTKTKTGQPVEVAHNQIMRNLVAERVAEREGPVRNRFHVVPNVAVSPYGWTWSPHLQVT